MVAHSPEMREVHERTYGKYRNLLETLLGQLAQTGAAPHFKLARRPSRSPRCSMAVGGAEPEFRGVQAAGSDRAVRGVGHRPMQRLFPWLLRGA